MTITELRPGTKDEDHPRRFEVFTGSGRRRDWSEEEKALIVEESYSFKQSVRAVARRHGLSPSQLFSWRRIARERQEPDPMFVPAIVEPPEGAKSKIPRSPSRQSCSTVPAIVLTVDKMTVKIAAHADAAIIAAVIQALKASL
jgi:transposase